MTTGEVRVTVTSYDADAATGSIRSIHFQAEFRAPKIFTFEAALKPTPVECPPPAE